MHNLLCGCVGGSGHGGRGIEVERPGKAREEGEEAYSRRRELPIVVTVSGVRVWSLLEMMPFLFPRFQQASDDDDSLPARPEEPEESAAEKIYATLRECREQADPKRQKGVKMQG